MARSILAGWQPVALSDQVVAALRARGNQHEPLDEIIRRLLRVVEESCRPS